MSLRTETSTRIGLVRQYPFDLAIVSLAAVLAYVAITNLPPGSSIRLLVGLPLVAVLPGYALVSVLFPAAERGARTVTATEHAQRPRGVDPIERVGLALALSIAIVVLLALALPFTEWGLTEGPTIAGLVVVTIALAQLGVVRRLRTPQSKRFSVSPLAALARLRNARRTRLSSAVLMVAIGVAAGALVFALLAPASAGGFTELGLYTEDDDGELVAGDLPNEVAPGESIPVTIAIENQEGSQQEYAIVVQQQTVEDGDVVESQELQEIEASVSDGNTATGEHTISPAADPGETVRISVLLYEDAPPAEPTDENADEDVYFWVTISDD